MPMVGKKEYPYTAKGKAAAKAEAKKTGKPMKKAKGYNMGGSLKKPSASQKGVKKLPKDVRNKMGYMNMGGPVDKNTGMMMQQQPTSMPNPQGMMQQQPKQAMMYGGKVKKGYAKGGKTGYANCGASMKATQSGTSK